MSNIVEKPDFQADMTIDERERLHKYVEAGIPGISKVSEEQIIQAFNLYMSGRGYEEISKSLGVSYTKILFLANKYNWFDKKSKHLEALMSKVGDKMRSAKIEGMSFILDLLSFYHKSQGSAVEDFLKTNDPEAAKKVDLKNLSTYFKTVDALHKMANTPDMWREADRLAQNPSPAVNVNLNFGDATIEKSADGSVSIKGNDSSTILRELVELKKLKQKETE